MKNSFVQQKYKSQVANLHTRCQRVPGSDAGSAAAADRAADQVGAQVPDVGRREGRPSVRAQTGSARGADDRDPHRGGTQRAQQGTCHAAVFSAVPASHFSKWRIALKRDGIPFFAAAESLFCSKGDSLLLGPRFKVEAQETLKNEIELALLNQFRLHLR